MALKDSLFKRARQKTLEWLLPSVHEAMRRRHYAKGWASGRLESDQVPWHLPEGTIPQSVRAAVESGWFKPNGKALDIGCGSGQIAAYLASAGFDVLAVDFAAPAIELANTKYPARERLRFQVLDVCSGSLTRDSFDVLIDRGCYHGLPAAFRKSFVHGLADCSRSGAHFLMMHKVSSESNLTGPEKIDLSETLVEALRRAFAPLFSIESTLPIYFNPYGDEFKPENSLTGLTLRMIRRERSNSAPRPYW